MKRLLVLCLSSLILLSGCTFDKEQAVDTFNQVHGVVSDYHTENIQAAEDSISSGISVEVSTPTENTSEDFTQYYADDGIYSSAYIEVNNNKPEFKPADISTSSFETYSELDDLGRCGVAYACIGVDLMPTEERGSIGSVKPSGWQSIKYDVVDGKYLYNRCHLIGYQLTAENANEKNLITGTRYLNVIGMLPFENMVADYIQETNNHVLYRVTPDFHGDELVARGVKIEAYSVEDNGSGVSFNVYCFNIQPGVIIDYTNGNSQLDEGYIEEDDYSSDYEKEDYIEEVGTYVINTSTMKFHTNDCRYANTDSENMERVLSERQSLIDQGYEPCKVCNP